MNDRLSWRIFGLIYAHPHPKDPDTTLIRNEAGLPLPSDFDGGYASEYLIGEEDQTNRTKSMQATCLGCHDRAWVRGHWKRFENTIRQTNDSTRVATGLMEKIWTSGRAQGLDRGGSPFDEAVEKTWSDIWLFYANTVRFSSAMAGGGDYGVFADGRYELAKGIAELAEWLELRERPQTQE
jgi:hydroxylamine dehydrogenase